MVKNHIFKILWISVSFFILSGCFEGEKSVAEWPHAAVAVLDADISRDGKLALISSVNFGAALWDLENNQLKFQWKHSDDPQRGITALRLSPDGKRAITADEDTFIIWNTNTGKAYGYWQAPAEIRAVAISDLGRYVLLGLADGRAIHMDMNTGRRLEFTGHRDEAVASVDMSANGVWAFTGGNDYRAILWNSKTGQPRHLFEHATRVVKLKLDPSGTQAFTAGTVGNAFVWDLTTGEQKVKLNLKKKEYVLSAANFSSDGTQVVTGAPGRDISLWNVSDGKRVKQWRVRTRDRGRPSGAIVYAVAFTENDQFILSESSAGFGEKWQVNTTR
ncbi:hypothetical protein FLL45_12410 [Aliikangiella marina]|uniref:Uncharacterized protein n=1 Tax=Aliikangiella marina TaxID=1712262 RepID=A0A545T8Y6_9GAMM|nr:hypothetical protein [Aliikangiella marina]TQV73669.1 hypothetical protein FLL45_12410 [Aliikangiella marina]